MTITSKEQEYWKGCYSGNFDMITPESFAHPAKMSPSLCFRIIEHLEELGLLKSGATILDPMSGTGLTAICANAKGYRAITCELESKFIGFQQKNKEYAGRKLGKELDWQIIQGDSRKLSDLLSERGLVTVSSPPYQEAGDNRRYGGLREHSWVSPHGVQSKVYGKTEGQLGNLPDKPLTVTSPPYDGDPGHHGNDLNGIRKDKGLPADYGTSEGQIGDTKSETYLSAMKNVYAEIAKISDVCVVVTKNPTRNGKLRCLDLDTVALLKEVGFSILCHHKAVLFEEHETQDLFGVNHKKVKGRMSFFKRLSYQKGSPVAAWEDVIFAVKNGKNELVTVSSPPFSEAGGMTDKSHQTVRKNAVRFSDYGTTPGQIGNLKDR